MCVLDTYRGSSAPAGSLPSAHQVHTCIVHSLLSCSSSLGCFKQARYQTDFQKACTEGVFPLSRARSLGVTFGIRPRPTGVWRVCILPLLAPCTGRMWPAGRARARGCACRTTLGVVTSRHPPSECPRGCAAHCKLCGALPPFHHAQQASFPHSSAHAHNTPAHTTPAQAAHPSFLQD